MNICIYMCAYIYIQTSTSICIWDIDVYTQMFPENNPIIVNFPVRNNIEYMDLYLCPHMYIDPYRSIYVCMCLHLFIYIYIYVFVYIYIYVYIYVTHIHRYVCWYTYINGYRYVHQYMYYI